MSEPSHREIRPVNSPSSPGGVWRLRLERGASAARQVAHGFLLPLVVLQALLRDPAERRRYFKVTLVQAALTLAVAVALVPVFRAATRVSDEVEKEAEVALQKTLGVVQQGIATAVDQRDDTTDGTPREDVLGVLDRNAAEFRSELDAIKIVPAPPAPPSLSGLPPPPPLPPDAVRSREVRQRGNVRILRREEIAAQQAEARREDARNRAEEARARVEARMAEQAERQEAQQERAAEAQARAEEQAEREADRAEEAQRRADAAAARQAEAVERQTEAAERAAARQSQVAEQQAELHERAQEARERALEQSAEIRERADEIRMAAQEAAQEAAAALKSNPELASEIAKAQAELQTELAADQAQLQRELAQNQAQLQKEMAQLQRSTEAFAKLAALRATEAVRVRVGGAETPVDIDAALESIEARLDEGLDDEALSDQQRMDLAMQSAVEASFVAERARNDARALRQELRRGGLSDEAVEVIEERLEEAEERAAEARALAQAARSEAKARLKKVAVVRRRAPDAPAAPQQQLAEALVELSPMNQFLLYLAALYAALYVVQFVVITFSRDYHDLLSRKAALATGIEPEDPDIQPRVRIDWHWLRNRLYRRWRAIKLFAFGVPLIYLVAWPIPGDAVRNALLSVWGAYWFAVFVAAKSARAWVDEGLARDPWFLRAANSVARKARLLRTTPFTLYGSLWRKHGGSVFAPAECVEQQPYAFAGLTVFRFLASLPLLKIFLRPLTPIAVAHLLEAHRVDHPPRAIKVAEVLADEPPRTPPSGFATVH